MQMLPAGRTGAHQPQPDGLGGMARPETMGPQEQDAVPDLIAP